MSSLSVILQADTSGFTKAVQDAKALLEQYTLKNKELANQIKSATGVTDEQVNAYKRIIRQLEKVGSGTMSTTQLEKALSNQIKELKVEWNKLSETAKNSDFGKSISEQTRAAQEQLKQLRELMRAVSGDMDKSSEKVENLSGKLSGNLLSSITSLIGKFAVLAGVQQVFDRLVNSNQGSADTFAEYMYAAKTAVDEFFYSISTGDWTAMSNGLNNLITRAREAAAAVDLLGNTIMSYSVVKTETLDEIARLNAIIYDPKSTKELVELAEKDMKTLLGKLAEATQSTINDTNKKLLTNVAAGSNIELTVNDIPFIRDALVVNAKEEEERKKELKKYDDKYEEYVRKKKEIDARYTVNRPNSLGFSTSTLNETDEYKEELKLLQERNPEFRKAIVYNTLLKKATDELLQTITDTYNESVKLNSELLNTTALIQRLTNRGNNKFNITTPKITEPDLKVKPLDLTVKPILIGRTEKQIKDDIKKIQEKIDNTPDGVVRIGLILQKEDLEKELKDFGKNPILIEIEAKASNLDLSGVKNADLTIGVGDKSEVLKKNAEGINEMLSSSERLYSVWNRIGDSFDNGNIIEQFFAISNAISSTIDSVQNLINGFLQVGEAVQTLSAIYSAASQQKLQEDNAETVSNLTKASSASTAAVSEGVHKAVSTSKTWQEVIIAIAAVISAITAALAVAGKFANGGIVQGKSSIGDYNLIRVNAGEAVLNKNQQAKLFRILNGQLNPVSNNNITGEVSFKVEGSLLVGVLNNYNRKRSKI